MQHFMAFMKAMKGEARWDELYESPAALKAHMACLSEPVQQGEGVGKKGASSQAMVRVVGGASAESASADFTPEGSWRLRSSSHGGRA